uniref:Uncharacterized protein n=1 Tax=Salix viminalis TaxID=40686 RepID=A0A6N2NC28_SALVM
MDLSPFIYYCHQNHENSSILRNRNEKGKNKYQERPLLSELGVAPEIQAALHDQDDGNQRLYQKYIKETCLEKKEPFHSQVLILLAKKCEGWGPDFPTTSFLPCGLASQVLVLEKSKHIDVVLE